jgi:hypothetical protein
MTKKSEDIIVLSTNQASELDKYHMSRIRAQTASMKLGLEDNKLISPICPRTREVGVGPDFPHKTDHEIRRITQIMFFCHLLATGMAD